MVPSVTPTVACLTSPFSSPAILFLLPPCINTDIRSTGVLGIEPTTLAKLSTYSTIEPESCHFVFLKEQPQASRATLLPQNLQIDSESSPRSVWCLCYGVWPTLFSSVPDSTAFQVPLQLSVFHRLPKQAGMWGDRTLWRHHMV